MSLKCIPGEKLAYLASTFAIALSQELDLDDVNILSNFFNAIGDSLGVIAAQRSACSNSNTSSTTNSNTSSTTNSNTSSATNSNTSSTTNSNTSSATNSNTSSATNSNASSATNSSQAKKNSKSSFT